MNYGYVNHILIPQRCIMTLSSLASHDRVTIDAPRALLSDAIGRMEAI